MKCHLTQLVSVTISIGHKQLDYRRARLDMNLQLNVVVPRDVSRSNGEAWKCSTTRTHVDQDSPVSTVPVRQTALRCSSDALTTLLALVELDGAARPRRCSESSSHGCVSPIGIETVSSRAYGP